jgi:hypothetical protein
MSLELAFTLIIGTLTVVLSVLTVRDGMMKKQGP